MQTPGYTECAGFHPSPVLSCHGNSMSPALKNCSPLWPCGEHSCEAQDVLAQAGLATQQTARSGYKETGSHVPSLRQSTFLQTKWGLKSPRTLGVRWGSAQNPTLCLFTFRRMMPTFFSVANAHFSPCFEVAQESSKCSLSGYRIIIHLSKANLLGGEG